MNKKTLLALLGIMILAAFFRFYDLGNVPHGLYPDEAMNGNNALEALSPAGHFKLYYPENNGREGLFMNLQAISVAAFGNEPWALRLVSGIFGTLTVLGVFFLARVLFKDDEIALLAALFIATSFWHINFSRIGFRAIMAPFFLTWGLYFLWRALFRESQTGNFRYPWKKWALLAAGGLFFGGGLHSYIAYRVAPLLLAFPFFKHLKMTLAVGKQVLMPSLEYKKFAATWGIFLGAALLAALPLLTYYALNPADFFGRTAQISIFSLENPVRELLVNTAKTIGMFFWAGDYNWRHNLSGAPELWWPVAIAFALGLIVALARRTVKYWLLLSWLAVMLLPVVVSAEGIPHALRAILVIPPVMILAALGAKVLIDGVRDWFMKNIALYPEYADQLSRIKKEMRLLFAAFVIALIANTFIAYFWRWGASIETFNAFAGRYAEIGYYLRALPNDLPKYVIVNASGTDVRGLPMPTQTIMYLTDTFMPDKQAAKNLHYIFPRDASTFTCPNNCFVVALEHDAALYGRLKEKAPGLILDTSPGFAALKK
ncbi:MAG: glycosyltransferase family 39 protein [Candidatus Niyogibacteria bacterium]|nr:glycosyltransferase family 39 protein [Candidatus Niyogibacteria bacterium]